MKTRKNKGYNVDEVVSQLYKKHDCKIDSRAKTIQVLNGRSKKQQLKNDLGNGSWGKIDFLINHCGFVKISVAEF
jgi:hypothetical protein